MRRAALAGFGLGLALLVGCASAPPERFHTLSSAGPPRLGLARPALSVVVSPAAVPDLVDRPQLVVHETANQVAILEQQRWAEPLRAGVARVVAEDLGRLLGTSQVSTRDEALRSPDCRVYLDVRRLEARTGAAVTVDALWTVTCAGSPRQTGQSLASAPISGAGYEAVVTAHGRVLGRLSHDIAAAVRARSAPAATLSRNH